MPSKLRFFGLRKPKTTSFYSTSFLFVFIVCCALCAKAGNDVASLFLPSLPSLPTLPTLPTKKNNFSLLTTHYSVL